MAAKFANINVKAPTLDVPGKKPPDNFTDAVG